MTAEDVVDNSNKKEDGNNVLVGIQMDSSSRELLDWALVKIAEPRDRVIAVLACHNSEEDSPKLVQSLKDYLAVYKGICCARKIDLLGQVSGGESIRSVLVREAKLSGASTVLVGINKHNAFGRSLSLAQYCAKMLWPCTSVLALKNGKIVFQKDATKPLSGLQMDSRPSLRSILYPSLSMDVKVIITGHEDKPEKEVSKNTKTVNPIVSTFSRTDGRLEETKIEHNSPRTEIDSCTKCAENEARSSSSSTCQSTADMDGEAEHFYPALEPPTEFTLRSISHGTSKPVETTPGWPLLRKATSANMETFKYNEARQMSVVEWVMHLPNRSTQSSALSTPRSRIGSNNWLNEVGKAMSECGEKCVKNRLSAWLEMPKELEAILIANSSSCRWFCRKELQSSKTKSSKENLIGKGGCSRVYKGCLPSGKPVAVKIMESSQESWKNFLLEVDIITSLQHKHILPLIGLCVEDNELISVYDFLSRGSLEDNLYRKGKKFVLPWEVRFKVAVGIAEALNYLHKTCRRPIIHRDVKSSNILLSDEYDPKLSDFGLAVLAPTTSSYVTHSDVVGTFGYLAPEYFMYGKVSDKIDVYSYGVVLLELLSGRKPISTDTPKGQESLVMWATPILQHGDVAVLIDKKLGGHYDENQMKRMILAASLCTTRTARLRPPMSQILKLLQGDEDAVRWAMSQGNAYKESDHQDGQSYPAPNVHSHQLGLSLHEGKDDSASVSSTEPNTHRSLEGYLRDRWSRSSSFD